MNGRKESPTYSTGDRVTLNPCLMHFNSLAHGQRERCCALFKLFCIHSFSLPLSSFFSKISFVLHSFCCYLCMHNPTVHFHRFYALYHQHASIVCAHIQAARWWNMSLFLHYSILFYFVQCAQNNLIRFCVNNCICELFTSCLVLFSNVATSPPHICRQIINDLAIEIKAMQMQPTQIKRIKCSPASKFLKPIFCSLLNIICSPLYRGDD